VIDFLGKKDGVPFQGGQATDYPFVLGQGMMLPDFENAVEGAAVGESKTFDLAFPLITTRRPSWTNSSVRNYRQAGPGTQACRNWTLSSPLAWESPMATSPRCVLKSKPT
jgi:hypothetical protein